MVNEKKISLHKRFSLYSYFVLQPVLTVLIFCLCFFICTESAICAIKQYKERVDESYIVERYMEDNVKLESFSYDFDIYINIRTIPVDDSSDILNYISEWYKSYSRVFKFSLKEYPRFVDIIVIPGIIKLVKEGRVAGFSSDFSVVDTGDTYCFVEAVNDAADDGYFSNAAILMDPTMGGDVRGCFLESFVSLFGFKASLKKFIDDSGFYAGSFSESGVDAAQIKAFEIRRRCQSLLGKQGFGGCVREELNRD